MVFGKRSSRLLARFFKFFIMARLPLRQTLTVDRRLQRELCQADCRLYPIVVVNEPQVTYGPSSQIMSYILNMLICVGMILLDNLLQYFLYNTMIGTCSSTASLICIALVMLMIYP
jgi:hypothetical protein